MAQRGWARGARSAFGCLLVVAALGCGREPLATESVGWARLPAVDFSQHPNERWLRGRRIGLDPGHGADADPLKKFEADANLAVALELTRLLERAGATVLLTRRKDQAVPLDRRAPMLVEQGAEIFISLHHNAGGENANYTSTWYHLDPDRQPADLDLARPIQRRVMEALRTPASLPTPILSDRLIYERSGFAVLRTATVPAILCEASFYTHPEERQRLGTHEYLQREAYAYYLGLVDYFQGGTPRARLERVKPAEARDSAELEAVFYLDDGLRSRGGWGAEEHRVLPSTILCTVDGRPRAFKYDRLTSLLEFSLSPAEAKQSIEVRFQNIYKHSNFPTRFRWNETDSEQRDPAGTGPSLEPVLERP